MPVADHGQWDTLGQQSDSELRSPHFRLITPEGYNDLAAAHAPLIQHPPHPRDPQQTLRDRIPTLDDLYNDYPQTTPLFLVNELLHSVSDALDDPDVPRTKLEYMLLMCLHRDWPANQPVQSPNAPPGPTVDYVRDREAWTVVLGERLVYATECARVCLSDGLKGRSERFGHAVPREPTARMFKSMAMLVSIELASILEHLHIDIASVVLKGKWAIEVANLQPKVRRVELSPIRRNSTTFDSQVSNDYHPRVSMTSNHLPVRSLHLARECLRDELDGVNWIGPHQIPAGAIYDRRGPTLNIGVDTWQNIVAALNLDVNDPASAFDIVSRALQDYVSEFGTGTHGGGAGPNVYAGYPRRAGGGCSIRRRKKPVPASERDSSAALPSSDAPEEELILSEILEKQDLVKMEELLIGAGYAVEDVDGPALSACFDAVMPCLELLDRISDLDSGSALDLVAANHPALLRPETAERALELFDAGLPDEQLGSRLALLADEAVSSVKAGTTTTAAAAETEFATSRQEQAPDAEAPASVPGSRARASAEAQGGDADALRPCTAPATSPKPLMVSDPQQLTDVTRTAGQKRPAELQIDAAPAKRPYQQTSGQLPQPAMPSLQEAPGGEARPNGSGLDKNLDQPPTQERSVRHLSPPHLTAADEHEIEDELSTAAGSGDASLGPCADAEPSTEMGNPLQSDFRKPNANSATAYDSVAADRPLSQLERRIARLTVESVPIHEVGPAVALVQTPAYGAPISDEFNTRVTISSSPQTSSLAAPPTPPESLRVTGPAGAACTEKRSAEPLASSSAKRPRQQSPSPEGVGISQEAATLSEEGLTASNFGPTYPQPRDPSDPNAFKGAITYVWKGSFRGSLPFRDVVADSWSADPPISVSTLKVWTEHMILTPHLRNVRAIVATRTATVPVPLVTIRVIFYNNDQFLRFAADQAIRRQTLKHEDDFYKFHNHYWRRHLRIENWASKEDRPSRYLPTGTDPARMPLFIPLNARDPNLESTEPDFVERIPGYPKPSSDQQRFMGKILRSPIHPTANFQAGYSINNVLRGSTSDQAMADSTLVALAEGIVPPTHISNVRFIGTANTGYDSYGAPLARVAIVFTTNDAYKFCMDSLVEEYGTSKPSQQPFLSWHNNFMRSLRSGIATDTRNTFTPFLKRPSFH